MLELRRWSLLSLALLLGLSLGCPPTSGDDDDDDDDSAMGDDDDDDDSVAVEYGPENEWFHALESEVPEGLEGTGYMVGDTAYNWTFVDQNGDEVELYQFYGKTVLVDVFAEWCGPCQAHAPEGENIWQQVEERGVVVLAAMQQVDSGAAPTGADDAARWAGRYSLTHPVVADTTGANDQFAVIGGGFPTYPLIGPDMTIIYQDVYPPSMALLTQVMEAEGLW